MISLGNLGNIDAARVRAIQDSYMTGAVDPEDGGIGAGAAGVTGTTAGTTAGAATGGGTGYTGPRGGYPGNYNAGNNLPAVDDPDEAYADLTRQEYLDYVNNYRDFELGLIEKATTDTSLIDQAKEDRDRASALTKGIAERNRSRYGAALTPVQQQQMQRRLQLGNTLGGIQAVSDAKIAQRESNTRLLADLINIGQGVNRSSQQQLATSAANKVALDNAYAQAKANSRAQTYSTIGSLGAAAIFAFAF